MQKTWDSISASPLLLFAYMILRTYPRCYPSSIFVNKKHNLRQSLIVNLWDILHCKKQQQKQLNKNSGNSILWYRRNKPYVDTRNMQYKTINKFSSSSHYRMQQWQILVITAVSAMPSLVKQDLYMWPILPANPSREPETINSKPGAAEAYRLIRYL